jgi:hypothetical protein
MRNPRLFTGYLLHEGCAHVLWFPSDKCVELLMLGIIL